MRNFHFDGLRIAVHAGSIAPLVVLIWNATQHRLSVNPIQDITRITGHTALMLLVISLACTPANTLFGFRRALTVRRALGLYAFSYAALHLLTFAVLDFGLDWEQIASEIAQKRYVLVGFAAFLILLPMAITSTRGWMKRLGKRWRTLHHWVYLAAILAVVHFIWLVKSDIREPLRFGAVVLVLLGLRLPPVRRAASNLRDRVRGVFRSARSRREPRTGMTSEITSKAESEFHSVR